MYLILYVFILYIFVDTVYGFVYALGMLGYTKIFEDILGSTIWQEDDRTRLVWITMLVSKGRDHVVRLSLPGLAHLARVPIEDCEAALKKFQQPDPHSRSQEFEGRRIEAVPGGWQILNGEKYRAKMGVEERKEYLRVKQQEHREKMRNLRKEQTAREVIQERVKIREGQ